MNKLIGLFLLSLSASLSGVSHQVEAVAQGVEERVAPTGQLVVIDQRAVPQHRIVTIDAATKTIIPLFSAPDFSRIHQLAVSPDGHSVIFAYTHRQAMALVFSIVAQSIVCRLIHSRQLLSACLVVPIRKSST